MQQQQKQAEPEMQEGQPEVDQEYPKSKFREIEPELDDYDDDRDSLEKAQLSSSEEEEFTHRNIQITSTNRIVKKPSKSPPKPKKRLIKEEMPLKKSAIRYVKALLIFQNKISGQRNLRKIYKNKFVKWICLILQRFFEIFGQTLRQRTS